jgi:hypothetical protein
VQLGVLFLNLTKASTPNCQSVSPRIDSFQGYDIIQPESTNMGLFARRNTSDGLVAPVAPGRGSEHGGLVFVKLLCNNPALNLKKER